MEVRAGCKQTEVGVLPTDWCIHRLERISTQIGDGLHGTPIYSQNEDYFFVNGNNLKNGKIVITSDTKSIGHFEFIKYKKSLSNRSILLSINGTIGNLAIYDDEKIVLAKSAAFLNIRQDICKSFIYYALQSDIVKNQFLDGLTGSTICNLGLVTIRNTQIPTPSTTIEQEAIAEALCDADALIDSLEKLIEKKRQIKQGAMQELLTGKKRLPGFSGEWKEISLAKVLKFQVGFPFSSLFFNEDNQGLRLVKNRDLKNDGQIFHYSGKHEEAFLVKNGDVLIGMDGDFIPCLWNKGTALLNQRVGRILPIHNLNLRFAYYFLIDPLKEIESSTSATTVKHLSHRDIEGITAPLPSIEEQTAIANILSDMDEELDFLETKLTKARQLKQGMMQALLTGKIRLV